MASHGPRAALFVQRLAAACTLVAVGLGSVVCATRSGFDCHSWPGCYDDRFAPGPADIPAVLNANPALEMIHRVFVMGTGAVLLVAAILALLVPQASKLVKILPWVALIAAGVSALYGRATVLGLGVDSIGGANDLLAALICMSASLYVAVALGHHPQPPRFNRLARTAFGAALVMTAMHVLGVIAAGYRSFTRCMSWPIMWLAHDDSFGVQVVRSVLAVAAVGLVVLTVRQASRHARLRAHGFVLGALLAAAVALAIAYRATGADGGVLGVTFSVVSVLLLWTTVFLGARAAFAPVTTASPAPSQRELVDA